MGTQTHKSMKTSRNRAPSAKMCANTQKISKSALKRIKSNEFIDSDTLAKESTPAPPESSPPPVEQLENVSDIKYHFAISYMLSPISIFSNTKKNKSQLI